jgi:hypothetical protein
MTPAQTLARLNTCHTISRQLETQRQLVGAPGIADNLSGVLKIHSK